MDGSQDGKKDMVFINSLLQAKYHPRMLKGDTILKLLKIEKAKGKKKIVEHFFAVLMLRGIV